MVYNFPNNIFSVYFPTICMSGGRFSVVKAFVIMPAKLRTEAVWYQSLNGDLVDYYLKFWDIFAKMNTLELVKLENLTSSYLHAVNCLSPHYNSIFLDDHSSCKRNKILCKEKCIFEIFGGFTSCQKYSLIKIWKLGNFC